MVPTYFVLRTRWQTIVMAIHAGDCAANQVLQRNGSYKFGPALNAHLQLA